jgi:hypothetical protein
MQYAITIMIVSLIMMRVMKYFFVNIIAICCYCLFIQADRIAIASPKPVVTVEILDWQKSWSPWGWNRLSVKISLKNPTDDTVRFIAGSCHWGHFLVTNNDSIRVHPGIDCNISSPTLYKIAPHESMTDIFSMLCYKKTGWIAGAAIKIGYRYYNGSGIKSLPEKFSFHKKKHEKLWSEPFTIPPLKTID